MLLGLWTVEHLLHPVKHSTSLGKPLPPQPSHRCTRRMSRRRNYRFAAPRHTHAGVRTRARRSFGQLAWALRRAMLHSTGTILNAVTPNCTGLFHRANRLGSRRFAAPGLSVYDAVVTWGKVAAVVLLPASC